MQIIHFTDTHIQAPESKPFMGLDTTRKFREAVALLRQMKAEPACFIISGDLCHEGNAGDYRHLRALLDEELGSFGVPVLVGLGNHDHRTPFRQGFLDQADGDLEQPYYYATLIGDLRVIMLNSQQPKQVAGFLDEAQLSWLKSELAQPAPGGNLIVLHHPPITTPHPLLQQDHLLTNPEALSEAIEGHEVLGILSGHIHFNSLGTLNGVLSAAGTGVAFGLEATTPDGMRFLDNCGFNIIAVREGQMMVQPVVLPGPQTEIMYLSVQKLEELAAAHFETA